MFAGGEGGGELGARAGDARADGADGAVAECCGFVVAVAEEWGECERLALVVGEFVEEEFEVDVGGVVVVGTS